MLVLDLKNLHLFQHQNKWPDFYRRWTAEVHQPLQSQLEMLSAGSQKPGLRWAGVESNPFTYPGRDLPVPQIRIKALEKGHIRSILTWSKGCRSMNRFGAPDPTPNSFILSQPGQTWNSICPGTSARNLESSQRLKQVQIRNEITCRMCEIHDFLKRVVKFIFLSVFCQQIHCSASACSFPKWAF